MRTLDIGTLEQTQFAAAQFISALHRPALICLHGDLGAGKTTFVRYCLQALGWQDVVPSPTYTYVQDYTVSGKTIFHIDAYRIDSDDQALEVGLYDCLHHTCFIEWPDKIANILPKNTIDLYFKTDQGKRYLEIHNEQ